jgi:2-dehydro-3-deoxyphosphogluconate aldolase/(4S)-4-hydroxy-2-oxoglutarate aldolase
MEKEKIIEKIRDCGILPVIAVNEADQAVPLAEACVSSGLNALEITFRTACAAEALKQIKNAFPELLLGAGTVLTCAQADQAMEIGVDFIVTPGFNPELVKYVTGKDFPIVPGVSTPSEIEQAMALGLDTLKFFPAEQSGGVGAIKAFGGPYKKLSFIPTGGMTFDNFTDYTSLDNVVAIGGSFMINKKHIADKDVEAMKEDIRTVIDRLLGLKLAHIGINCENEDDAAGIAGLLKQYLNKEYKIGNSSIFSGNKEFELMKKPGRGRNGHIAIGVSDIGRGMNYLKKRGVDFDDDSLVIKDNKKTAIYFRDEIGGFAFHLMKI